MTDIRCRNCNSFNTTVITQIFCKECGVTRQEPYIDQVISRWIEEEAQKKAEENKK